MASVRSDEMQLRAAQACLACRKQKRRCDKCFPSCTLCARMGRPCDYTDATPAPSVDDFISLQQKVADLEARLGTSSNDAGRIASNGSYTPDGPSPEVAPGLPATAASFPFPTMFFLDSMVFADAGLTVPRPPVPVPSEILTILGPPNDIQKALDTYYVTIHTWLPIVSKKRLQLTLRDLHVDPPADLALVLLCVKLIIQPVSGDSSYGRDSLYWTCKNFLNLLESAGLLSVQLLQAALLIATYEIGHAIYPVAYLTTGQCARLGHAMNLHSRRGRSQILKHPASWAEGEERKRVWWAVVLLDRYVNIGSPGRPLATEEPHRSDNLPVDDQLWDEGELTISEPLYVSSPTSVHCGVFARLCQSTNLLGKVVNHFNDRSMESALRFSEAAQIQRTLVALTTLLYAHLQQAPQNYSASIALCYGAIIHLCDPYSCTGLNSGEYAVEKIEMQGIAIAGLKSAAADVVRFSKDLREAMSRNLAAISPFVGDCLYQAAATYAWLVHEHGSAEMTHAYHELVETLTLMSGRWSVASEYLKHLETAREILYTNA